MKKFLLGTLSFALVLSFSVSAMADDAKIEKFFKKMDKNGDNKVTLEEYVGKKEGDKAEKAKKRFGKVDKDGDKAITLEELKAATKKKDDDAK